MVHLRLFALLICRSSLSWKLNTMLWTLRDNRTQISNMWAWRFSQQCVQRSLYRGLWYHVVWWVFTKIWAILLLLKSDESTAIAPRTIWRVTARLSSGMLSCTVQRLSTKVTLFTACWCIIVCSLIEGYHRENFCLHLQDETLWSIAKFLPYYVVPHPRMQHS